MSSSKVNVPILVGGLAVIGILVAILGSGFGNDPREVPSMLVGKAATNFVLEDLDGNLVSTKELRGRKIVLNFWSTWCLPCKQEHPLLQEAARRYPDVTFLGVIYSDEPEKARRFLARKDSAYANLIDPGGHVSIDYGVAGVPETFFIDAQGKIMHKQVGPVDVPLIENLLGRR